MKPYPHCHVSGVRPAGCALKGQKPLYDDAQDGPSTIFFSKPGNNFSPKHAHPDLHTRSFDICNLSPPFSRLKSSCPNGLLGIRSCAFDAQPCLAQCNTLSNLLQPPLFGINLSGLGFQGKLVKNHYAVRFLWVLLDTSSPCLRTSKILRYLRYVDIEK